MHTVTLFCSHRILEIIYSSAPHGHTQNTHIALRDISELAYIDPRNLKRVLACPSGIRMAWVRGLMIVLVMRSNEIIICALVVCDCLSFVTKLIHEAVLHFSSRLVIQTPQFTQS